MDTIAYWVSLHKILYFHARKYSKLKDFFPSPQDIWRATKKELMAAGLNAKEVDEIIQGRQRIAPGREMEKIINSKTRVIFYDGSAYPDLLRNIYDPPAILYLRGQLPSTNKFIAMVGARRATPYGLQIAEKLAGELAMQEVCVVSGMARGIDSAAHRGVLAKKGQTIAVLGCGVDVVYPPENKKLKEQIENNGAVISEYPLGTQPLPVYFPLRNRIISGLSQGTMVVEAAEKSGSLITVDQALEQGREVFAVPGNITSALSKGPHKLIKQGAKIVDNINDILEEFGWLPDEENQAGQRAVNAQLTLEENLLYSHMSFEPIHIESLINVTEMPSAQVSSLLVFMELKGLVKKLPGQYYVVNVI